MHNLHPAMDSMCTARVRPMDNGNAVIHSPYTACAHPAHSRISVQVIHPFHTTAAVYGIQRASRLILSSRASAFFSLYGQESAMYCARAAAAAGRKSRGAFLPRFRQDAGSLFHAFQQAMRQVFQPQHVIPHA